MLFGKRPPLASTPTSTPAAPPSPPLAAPEKAPLLATTAHTTSLPHNNRNNILKHKLSTSGRNNDRKHTITRTTTAAANTLLYARVHGLIFACFVWSIWCCDHYQMTPFITVLVLFIGVLYFLWWYRRSSTTVPSSQHISSKLADRLTTYPPQMPRGKGEEAYCPVVSGASTDVSLPSMSVQASIATASVSACSVSSSITVSVLAQDHNNSNTNRNMGMSMPPTPTDPPPPYYHNNSTNESGSDGLTNSCSSRSGQCMQSEDEKMQLQLQLQQTATAARRSRLHQQKQFSRQRIAIHVWSAGASFVGFATWTAVSKFGPSLLLSILEAEDLLLMEVAPFSLWCWIVVTFVWVLYGMATFLLLSRGIVTKYLDADVHVDGTGSGTDAESEQQSQQLSNEEVIKEEDETESEREHTGQESCEKEVHAEDLSEIGQDIERAQQIVTTTPSLKALGRSVICRQNADGSLYNKGVSDTITIKRHRRGPPSTTAHKTWTTSVSLLQHVKHEIQIWSFSLWVLAPSIPRPFNLHHHQRPYQQPKQQYCSTDDIHNRKPRHPQLYGPVDVKDQRGLLLTTASSVPRENTEESEYDLVLSEEASGFNSDMVGSVVVVASKAEDKDGRRSSQDGRDGGNQSPIQDDGKTGSRSVLLQYEAHPSSFEQTPYHSSPRTGYMSQSMPDLHAIKRTFEPSPVESILARWSKMTREPERLGSIFQYYLRKQASMLKKEKYTDGYDDDDQDSTAGDESQDDINSHIDDHNDGDDEEADQGVTFVIRSSTLPTVRVGLYGADQKRLWTSSGSIHLSPLSEEPVVTHREGDAA